LGGNTVPTTTVTTQSLTDPNALAQWQNEILGTSGVQAAQGQFDATVGQLGATRADAIQRAVVNAGWAPDPSTWSGSLSGFAQDVTPGTIAAAQSNPMSTRAQLDLQMQQAQSNLPYDLAASGMGRSGAMPIQQGGLQRQYQLNTYQGQQNLLDAINQAASAYGQGYQGALGNLQNARSAAAQALAQLAGYSGTTTTTTTSGGGGPTDQTKVVKGAPTAAAPLYGGLPPASVTPNTTQAAVLRAIQATTPPTAQQPIPPPSIYRTLRNTSLYPGY
jgi:hypothetical protein